MSKAGEVAIAVNGGAIALIVLLWLAMRDPAKEPPTAALVWGAIWMAVVVLVAFTL